MIINRVQLKPGEVVGDLGTGREGRMAIAAGKIIGDHGKVYAVDVVKAILPVVATKAKLVGVNTIQTVWSDLEVYGAARAIADQTLTVAFMITVLFQSQKRYDMLHEAARMLQPGGRLVVVDWKPGTHTPFGPSEDRRVHASEVEHYAEQLNLKLVEQFEAGPYHWGLIFMK